MTGRFTTDCLSRLRRVESLPGERYHSANRFGGPEVNIETIIRPWQQQLMGPHDLHSRLTIVL